ncbi:hypothetical protein EC835_108102 [Providencia alcalifaciens]|uniref:Uncharacterized protein n=1 Tax=Providencia alcalifaciens TaxID=126385 RepID=A0A4R3NF34_9GAMM|nr:hypothetical protein EC835_108102 [Providencia alcalifaciens]
MLRYLSHDHFSKHFLLKSIFRKRSDENCVCQEQKNNDLKQGIVDIFWQYLVHRRKGSL